MTNYKMKTTLQRGFTLIELMIVVAIVGILASIAYPEYRGSVLKSRRSDGKANLLAFANAMERYYTEANSYCDAGGSGGANSCGDAGTLDTGVSSIFSPPDSAATLYDFKINAISDNTYTLYAERKLSQSNDKCGTLTLTHTGIKGIVGADLGVVTDDCW